MQTPTYEAVAPHCANDVCERILLVSRMLHLLLSMLHEGAECGHHASRMAVVKVFKDFNQI